jgi:glycosyltransferase involved in cell wall biosynthesis
MKVLACAYACNPVHGSEEGVGWGWVKAIARNHEVWVLTAGYHCRDVEESLRRDPDLRERLRFIFVEEKPWYYQPTRAWIRIENSLAKPIMNWAYRSWLRGAYVSSVRLHQEIGFDLIHQVTYVGFRFPGHLWKLDVPFVWGPIGGLENTPWRLLASMGTGGAAYYAARNVVNSAHKRFLRGPRKASQRATAIIAATSSIQAEILRWYGVPSEVICEVGSPVEAASEFDLRAPGEPLRIAWSGRHLPGKALHLLLRALARVPEAIDWRLDIYGDGPCRIKWQQLAVNLGIESRCIWHGQVSRREALFGLRSAHLFVTTSLKDLTSTVILEALANGVPVLCPDHCGFSDVVNESCGVKLPIGSAGGYQTALSRTIVELASNEPKRRQLALGALNRARDFSWEVKAEAINRVYERALRAARESNLAVSAAAIEPAAHS